MPSQRFRQLSNQTAEAGNPGGRPLTSPLWMPFVWIKGISYFLNMASATPPSHKTSYHGCPWLRTQINTRGMIELVLTRNGRLVCVCCGFRGGILTCSTPSAQLWCKRGQPWLLSTCWSSLWWGHDAEALQTRWGKLPHAFLLSCSTASKSISSLIFTSTIRQFIFFAQAYHPSWLIDPPGRHLQLALGTQQTQIHSTTLHWNPLPSNLPCDTTRHHHRFCHFPMPQTDQKDRCRCIGILCCNSRRTSHHSSVDAVVQ